MNRKEEEEIRPSRGMVIIEALEDEMACKKANGLDFSAIKFVRDYIENQRQWGGDQIKKYERLLAAMESIKEMKGLDRGKNNSLNAFNHMKESIDGLCKEHKDRVPTEEILEIMKIFQTRVLRAKK